MNLKMRLKNGVSNTYQIVIKNASPINFKMFSLYLEKGWSPKVANEFLLKIYRRIELLTKQPNRCNIIQSKRCKRFANFPS